MPEESLSIDQIILDRLNMLRALYLSLLTPLQTDLQEDIKLALSQRGKLLYEVSAMQEKFHLQLIPRWPLLVFAIVEAIAPESDMQQIGYIAVATECFICALDLLDDIEDEDKTTIIEQIGQARTLNVSTALLMLAYQYIIQSGLSNDLIMRLIATLQDHTIRAIEGQHLDLCTEAQEASTFNFSQCITIAERKAGSLLELVCHLAALCGYANEALCKKLVELGRLVGIAAQLDNDAHDLYYLFHNEAPFEIEQSEVVKNRYIKTDLVRHKKTLPIVLAMQSNMKEDLDQNPGTTMANALYDGFREGIISTWGISLLYYERARECFDDLKTQISIPPLLQYILGFH